MVVSMIIETITKNTFRFFQERLERSWTLLVTFGSAATNKIYQKQEHLLLKYAQQHDLKINDFINIRFITQRTKEQLNTIDELLGRLNEGDILLSCRTQSAATCLEVIVNIINQS